MAKIKVLNIMKIANPFNQHDNGYDVWGCSTRFATIRRAILEKRFQADSLQVMVKDEKSWSLTGSELTQWHSERIAYLVVNRWADAIYIDIGVPSMNYQPNWIITDGNHRVCAAIYRGDKFIEASITGDVDYAKELFGVDISEEE